METVDKTKEEEICKQILKITNNKQTKIIFEDSTKSSYYVFFNDTIYLTTKANKDKLVMICHECVHAIQSKSLQLLNFIASNIEIILFIIAIVLKVAKSLPTWFMWTYTIIAIISISIRCYLEMNATIGSLKLASKYMRFIGESNENIKFSIKNYRSKMLKVYPLFIIWLFLFKIVRIILVLI